MKIELNYKFKQNFFNILEKVCTLFIYYKMFKVVCLLCDFLIYRKTFCYAIFYII